MSVKPLLNLIKNNQLLALTGSVSLLKPFYQLNFLVAAHDSGLLALLHQAPRSFAQLAETFCGTPKSREALEAWLNLGIRLGCLRLDAHGYALKGLAKKVAQPHNDAALAFLQEAAGLHAALISQTLPKLTRRELFSLDDQDGEIIARSSRVMEAFQTEAIDRFFPTRGPARLLEIGCGSGIYIRHAALRNPALTALGLELQPNVAEVARQNIAAWGLAPRVTIETGDIRHRPAGELFNIVTLYNNIYYFPVDSRFALLSHIRQFIAPGGFLLLITCCLGGSLAVDILNLWGAATEAAGRLPSRDELITQLQQSGFTTVEAIRLIPGESLYAFRAQIP